MPNIFKSTLNILSSHCMTIVLALFGLFIFSWVNENYIGAIIYNSILLLIYISFIYSSAWNMGRKDARKIEGYFPDIKKAVKTAVIASIPSLLLFTVRVCVPFLFGNTAGSIMEVVYRVWFMSYIGFFGDGSNFIAYIIPLTIIPAFTVAGYAVGIRKFSIFDKIYPKIMFSAKKTKKEK